MYNHPADQEHPNNPCFEPLDEDVLEEEVNEQKEIFEEEIEELTDELLDEEHYEFERFNEPLLCIDLKNNDGRIEFRCYDEPTDEGVVGFFNVWVKDNFKMQKYVKDWREHDCLFTQFGITALIQVLDTVNNKAVILGEND